MGFRQTLQSFDDFPSLVENAKVAMAISNDVPRVEISEPDRPHLTVIDLPSLIHSENKLQTAADVEVVSELVQSYMADQRSIILAVISAKNDYANQIMLKRAKTVDSREF